MKQTQTTTQFSRREQQVADIKELYENERNIVNEENIPREKGEFFLLMYYDEEAY